MNISDVTKLPVAPHMPANVKQLRENAPRYLKSILERTYAIKEVKSLKELGQGALTPLGGGMLSAAYWLQIDGESRVIKLRYRGIDAEAKSLEAWRKKGADVVAVIAKGIVPETRQTDDKVKYLVLEGVTDKKGEVAPTCFEYVESHPEAIKKIGEILGNELFKIHSAKTTRSFGEFADMWGKNKAPLKTWNSYLQSFIIMHYDYLLTLGLTESKLKRLLQQVKEKKFPRRGTFVHGDYSLRNAMLTSKNPLEVKIFDPNPLIGDPSWDLAILYNNFEFEKRKHEYNTRKKAFHASYIRDKDTLEGLVKGYTESGGKIDEDAVAMSQLMQCIFLLQIEENKARKQKVDPEKEIEVMVRKDTLFDKVERLVY